MFRGSVTVAGAGVAGLATALLLAREGLEVTLVERDEPRGPEIAPEQRRGVPHYLQPHAMIPRARAELREVFPDVYADLLARGARDVDLRAKLPGPQVDADELLQYLAVRRPLLETALRAAVLAETRVSLRTGQRLGEAPEADLIVDAMGRRSFLSEPTESSDCGVVYYSRYYRQLPGFELPDGPWILSPRGDLGYCGFSTFPGDNRTFAAVLAVPPGDSDWKALREADAFERTVAAIPPLAAWADPRGCEPITDVLPMGGLRNTAPPTAAQPGLVAVGDSLAHTDPVLAHGLAFALIGARALRDVVREYADPADVADAYLGHVGPMVQERYDFVSALDAQRLDRWRGGAFDPKRDYELFVMVAGGALALRDADIFRVHVRRIGLLDSTRTLDEDQELQAAMAEQFADLPPPPRGPDRDELVALIRGVHDA